MRRDRQDGFTLVELLMSIALLGVVALTVVGVVFTVARSGVSNQNRLNQDNQVMLAGAFFGQDVAGAAGGTKGGLSTPASVPCGTLTGYYPLLQIIPGVIATPTTSTTLQAVFYAQSGTFAAPGSTLLRGECRGTTLAASTLSTMVLMSDLQTTSPLTVQCYAAGATTASACSASTTTAVSVSGTLAKNWQSGTVSTNFNLYGVRRAT